jgi:ABC-type nickel/cobalt efflux system permease component RcnA
MIQKAVNATVRAMLWAQSHSAEEIMAKLPPSFVPEDKEGYAQAIRNAMPILSPDGLFDPATLQVPHGCDGKATNEVRIKLPEGFISAKPMGVPASWTTHAHAHTHTYTYTHTHTHTHKENHLLEPVSVSFRFRQRWASPRSPSAHRG